MAEPLEARRVMAASFGWDGPGLGEAELTYTISNAPSSLSQDEVEAAIETALDAWSDAVDVTFTKVDQTGLNDSIDISFTNIDGSGGTLAQAYFPDDVNPSRIAGDIQFDLAEVWEVGNSLGNQAFDLVWVAAHEIGHSLGLDHLTDAGSVLQAYVTPNQQFTGLDDSDIAEALTLYAAATTTETNDDSVDDAPIDDTSADDSSGGDADDVDPTATDDTVDTDTTDSELPEDKTDDGGDSDNNPFSRRRWRRGGNWHRWGGRIEADVPENHNLYDPTDANDDGSISALDALVIINQLSRSNESTTGFSDVNGDGYVTALDALMVINSLVPTETEGTSEFVVVADPTDSGDESVESVDETTTSEDDSELTNSTPTVGSDDDTDVVADDDLDSEADSESDESGSETDSETGSETEETEGDTEQSDGETDEGDVDVSDPLDDETDETDEKDETIDDGGLTDLDGDDDDDSALCDHDHFSSFGHHKGIDHPRSFRVGFDQLLARYDANEDGSLGEDELPEIVWARLSENEVDADNDGLITADELDLAAEAKQEARFASKDSNDDGMLSEDEVGRFWQKLVAADTNSDGNISLDEFVDWLENREPTDSTTRVTSIASSQRAAINARSVNSDSLFAQLGRRGSRGRR
ncbi:Peptidase M10A and M12B, matrixin and adamalysin domain protein [Rhodopirellula maiorica SM1]|uniref:Peptidase M10A and M12B, matrixin and adamalysin domain protein n=2 Tax=Novipirellula TaxID=2795426 RepID=M5RRJ4_9BACT|nr:Peptidase M10A and M12B, matrixin and adamalysin domain protein [Rhodopirellula maiorica SM1]